jgi:hypothetical protein
MVLSGRQMEMERMPVAITEQVEFGRKSAARPA